MCANRLEAEPIARKIDLTGQWNGTYTYPRDYGPATPFLADLLDHDGVLTGSIIEPDAFHGTGITLQARLAGHCAEQGVDFTKTYVGGPFGYENPVDYVGQLSADGLSITGIWSLFEANGTFEMYRDAAAQAEESREDEAAIPDAPIVSRTRAIPAASRSIPRPPPGSQPKSSTTGGRACTR